MARREWEDNKVSDAQRRHPKLSMVEIAGLVAEAEHARAVWVVKRAIAAQKRNIELTLQRGHENNGRLHVFALAQLEAILAALERGRGKGGK